VTAYAVVDRDTGEIVATYRHKHVARQHAHDRDIRDGRPTRVEETR